MRILMVYLFGCWCLIAQANQAVTVRQLLSKPPPWDKERLAKIIGADLLHSMLGAVPKETIAKIFVGFESSDYEKNAIRKAMKEIGMLIAKETEKIDRPLIWQLVDPWGGQHKIFASIHNLKLDKFSTGAREKLVQAIDEATVLMSESGTGGKDSLDQVLAQIGLDKGRELVALDSLEHILSNHLALLVGVAVPTTAEEFTSFLENFVERLEFVYHLHSNYFKGDYQALQQLDLSNRILPEHIITSMLSERNEKFVEKIIDYCQRREQCFIFAGVLHMLPVTDQAPSVITLLEEHGFTVTHYTKK